MVNGCPDLKGGIKGHTCHVLGDHPQVEQDPDLSGETDKRIGVSVERLTRV